jgi:hypothetical protein
MLDWPVRVSPQEPSFRDVRITRVRILSRKQFQAKNSDPDLAALLGSVRIVPNGEGLEIWFGATNDQITNMIKRNTFSAKR